MAPDPGLTGVRQRTGARPPWSEAQAPHTVAHRLGAGLGDLAGGVATAVEQHVLEAAVTEDVLDLHPFPTEPALLEHLGRRQVRGRASPDEARDGKVAESEVEKTGQGFCAVALPPVVEADPVTHLGSGVRRRDVQQADSSDELRGALKGDGIRDAAP